VQWLFLQTEEPERERESVCVRGRQSTLGVKREATDAFG